MKRFILLKCRKCKANLEGENNSKVFFCRTCDLGYDIEGDFHVVYQLSYIEPKVKKELPQIYFPFWMLSCEFSITDSNGNSETKDEKNFYVAAFFIKNINYFGDIGYYLTQNNIALNYGKKKDFPIFPADRSFTNSSPFPLIYLYQDETKKKKKERSLEIDVKHKKTALVLIPFYYYNRQYFDSILFWKYPSGALI